MMDSGSVILALQLPDQLIKKSAVLVPTARFFLRAENPNNFFGKCVLVSDTHLDNTRTSLKEGFNDPEFDNLQTKIKGGEMKMFNSVDRTIEFPHLQISITGYQWFDMDGSSWKRVKGNRFSLRYLVFLFYEGQQYLSHMVHPVAVYSHPSQREPLRSILGYGLPSGTGVIPSVEDVIPESGPAFSQNTTCVTGSGFDGPAYVLFGQQGGIISTQKSTWLKCKTPNSVPGTVSVVVICAGRTSNDDIKYTFLPPPEPVQTELVLKDTQPMEDDYLFMKDSFEEDPFYPFSIEQQLDHMSGHEHLVYCQSLRSIHFAAAFGKTTMTQNLINKGQAIDLADNTGATPLFWAVWGGHANTVALLLNLGANPNTCNTFGETPLHISCLTGNIKIVKLLLEHFPLVNAQTKSGESPLFFAAAMGSTEILKLLLAHNANISIKNTIGETALDWAILAEHKEVTQLLENKVDIPLQAVSQDTPVRKVSFNTQKEGYIVKKGGKVGTWRRRFLSLETNELSYYKHCSKKEKQGTIPFNIISEVRTAAYKDRKNVFCIVTPYRTYFIQCEELIERQSWIDAINLILDTRKQESLKPKEMDFEQVGVIGKGSITGQVMLVRRKETKTLCAMRVLEKSVLNSKDKKQIAKIERTILAKLNHPFLAKLHCSFQSENKLFFVTDYGNGGSIAEHLQYGPFSLERVKFYVAQILSGLEYLHKSEILYRNLLPDNIFLTSTGYILMANFDVSKQGLESDPNPETFDGKTHTQYLAPEFISGGGYTKAIDYWSLGIITFEMFVGHPPFYSKEESNKNIIYQRILNDSVRVPDNIDKDSADLILSLLQKDPSIRLTDPSKIRLHQFFNDLDWNKLESMEMTSPFIPNLAVVHQSSLDSSDEFENFTYIPDSNNNQPTPPASHISVNEVETKKYTMLENIKDKKVESKTISRNRIRSVTEPPNVLSRPELRNDKPTKIESNVIKSDKPEEKIEHFENFTYVSKEFRSHSSPEEVDEQTRLKAKDNKQQHLKKMNSKERILDRFPGRLRSKKIKDSEGANNFQNVSAATVQ